MVNRTAFTLASTLCVAVLVSGCTSRVGALNTGPAPLQPAPSGTVTSNQLPPPATPNAFPAAPAPQTPVAPTPTEVAVNTPETPEVTLETPGAGNTGSSIQDVASAEPVTKEQMVGAWQVSTAGSSCQMFMALTQWTGGFRAASRGCPGDAADVSAWNVSGNQVVLSDSGGNRVATLFRSGTDRYDGQTNGGRAISLSR